MTESTPDTDTVLMLDRVTLRLRDRFFLADTTWVIREKENWAVLGPNGSGKSALVRALAGHVPVVRGRVYRAGPNTAAADIGYLSFESHQHLLAQEERLNESRFFSGNMNDGTTVRALLREEAHVCDELREKVMALMDLKRLVENPIATLSSGEMRKLLIARELLRSPQLIVLDEPFDGLDADSRKRLSGNIQDIITGGVQVILITHRLAEIPPGISHVIGVRNGRVAFQGPRDAVSTAETIKRLYHRPAPARSSSPAEPEEGPQKNRCRKPLIRMQAIHVAYGGKPIISNLDWTVNWGENWAVLGPNGSGKTTLLNLITGDNLQGYANRIDLFGKPKGSGESVWEIKQRIGLVSADLQLNYRRSITAREVVQSGFFDSVGLFRFCTPQQRETADNWIRQLQIEDLGDMVFDRLSNGERRMVLVARALVKHPDLLILDEPCQGLDINNRQRVLSLVDTVGRSKTTGLILVTHYEEEIVPSITHTLRLAAPDGFGKTPYTITIAKRQKRG